MQLRAEHVEVCQRHQRLQLVANNARLLVLPEGRRPNLASMVLARTIRRLSANWGAAYGHGVVVCLGVLGWLAGQRSYLGLGRWVADLPQPVLERVGCVRDGRVGRWQPPSETTLRRHLQATEPQALHQAVHTWLVGEARRVRRVVQVAQAAWTQTPDLALALGAQR